ncbi:MAG: hypothetical protein IT318_04100 [Anaerolineales bacterium]|nr:hypothetical protein [Anaerolineales bacterium]
MNQTQHVIHSLALASTLALAALACGLTEQVVDRVAGGGDELQAVAELWSDVPPMDGMTAAQQMEMPAWLKALARPVMDQMMKSLNDGQAAGHWDWTAFALSGTAPADVQVFYSPDRMAEHGWQQAEAACLPMGEQGVLCSFTKEAGGTTTGLIVLAALDEEQKQTSVFFLRAEGVDGTPAPGQPTAAPAPLALAPIAPITLGPDLTGIDLCRAIPQENIEAIMGRKLAKAPERFVYDDTPGQSGCAYLAAQDPDGEAHYGYVVLTPVAVYASQPLYLDVAVSGLAAEAYFNNGADTRQLWVKIDDRAAFVVAFGDVANEDYELALARLLVAAIK